jgi:hypothetical protein
LGLQELIFTAATSLIVNLHRIYQHRSFGSTLLSKRETQILHRARLKTGLRT